MSKKTISPIAIICSKFNPTITQVLLEQCVFELKQNNYSAEDYEIVMLPGAVEIPYAAKKLALTGKYDAIIALGAVIRGETRHFDYVCKMVTDGCMQVMLEQMIPIIFGVLTTDNIEQASARTDGSKKNLGRDAARSAIDMAKLN